MKHRYFVAAALLASSLSAQATDVLDETWTVTINGQVTTPEPDGTFRVANVSAADLFGLGGPGTPPDFISDDFLQLTATRTINGVTEYAFSERFQIDQRAGVYEIEGITITRTPPPAVHRLHMSISPGVLTFPGQIAQLQTIADLNSGGALDVTTREKWTIYRTSNPSIVTVDAGTGRVTARSNGRAYITAVNDGVTSVIKVDVIFGDPLTSVSGFAFLPDGSPATGGKATVIGHGQTGDVNFEGQYVIPGVPSQVGQLQVYVRASSQGDGYSGLTTPFDPVPGRTSDAGILELARGDGRVLVTNLASFGSNAPSDVVLTDLTRMLELDSLRLTVDAGDAVSLPNGDRVVLASEQGQRLVEVAIAANELAVGSETPLLFKPREVAWSDRGFVIAGSATTGDLAAVDIGIGATVGNHVLPNAVAGFDVEPQGRWVVAADTAGNVHSIGVNSNGGMAVIGSSVRSGGSRPSNVAMHPSGAFVVVTHSGSNSVGVIDVGADGALVLRTSVDISAVSQSLAFHPAGGAAFVYCPRSGDVRVLDIDSSGLVTYGGQRVGGLRRDGILANGIDQIAVTTDGLQILVHEPNRCAIVDANALTLLGFLGHSNNLGSGGVTPLGR